MDNEEYKDFTREEIINFPLELKVCFYLQGWNKSAKIQSVDDWIDTFWEWYRLQDNAENYTEREIRNKMRKDHKRALLFIKKYICIQKLEE